MKRLEIDELLLRIKDIQGDKYNYPNLYEEFKNMKSKITIECSVHGEFYQDMWHHLGRNFGCPKCSRRNKYDVIELENKLKQIHDNIFIYPKLKEEYATNLSIITIVCSVHEEFKMNLSNHMNKKYGCRKCHIENNVRYTNEEMLERFNDIHYYKYKYPYFDIEFKGVDSYVTITCPIHGNFKQKIHTHLYIKCGCPTCNESKGERKVSDILEKLCIRFERQYRFKDCKYKNTLPFDFYLPEHNICIEFDGQHHYKSVECFGGDKSLISQQFRDNIKNIYCKNNNIKLLRIKYDEDINEKIKSFII